MLEFHLDEALGIMRIKPHGALSREDFAALGDSIERYTAKTGVLGGILVDGARFPSWESFEAFRAHLGFIETHHMRVTRVAIVTDSTFVAMLPTIADIFVQSEMGIFHTEAEALRWLST